MAPPVRGRWGLIARWRVSLRAKPHCTVTVAFVVLKRLPLVAVMVMTYVPGVGEVCALLTVELDLLLVAAPPHPTPKAASNSRPEITAICLVRLLIPVPRTKMKPNAGSTVQPNGLRECDVVGAAALMVNTVDAPLAPGTTLEFEKLHVTNAGRSPQDSATGAMYILFTDLTPTFTLAEPPSATCTASGASVIE